MIGRLVLGLCLLSGAAHAQCLSATTGPRDPALRRARLASFLTALDTTRRRLHEYELGALDWDMRTHADPGSVFGVTGLQTDGTFDVDHCRSEPGPGLSYSGGRLKRTNATARLGDPSTPIMVRVSRLEQFEQLDSPIFLTERTTTLWMGEARVLRLAELAVARIDDPYVGRHWYGRLAVPRLHVSGAMITRDGEVEFIDAGLEGWPVSRAFVDVDARLGWLRDEAVAVASVAVERPIFGGYLVPRLEAQGEVGDAARIRTARAALRGVFDATTRRGGCPLFCYTVIGIEGEAAWQVSDAAFIEGITGARWARGPSVEGTVVVGIRAVSIRLGGYMAVNRFDTLTRLPDGVDRAVRGWRADARIGL